MLSSILAIIFVLRLSRNSDRYASKFLSIMEKLKFFHPPICIVLVWLLLLQLALKFNFLFLINCSGFSFTSPSKSARVLLLPLPSLRYLRMNLRICSLPFTSGVELPCYMLRFRTNARLIFFFAYPKAETLP